MAVALSQRQYQTETPDKVLMNASVVVPVTIGVSRGVKWGGSPTTSESFAQTNPRYYKRQDYHVGKHNSTLWGYFQLFRVFFNLCGNQNRYATLGKNMMFYEP